MEVLFTQGAVDDMADLKQSLTPKIWKQTASEIKDKLEFIQNNPLAQPSPSELSETVSKFKQGLTKYYRIIYEIRGDKIYIHLICNQARDLNTLFIRRINQYQL